MLKRFDEFGGNPIEAAARNPARSAALVCAACAGIISSAPGPVARGGTHRHCFVNPLGIAFDIGCFLNAEGSRGAGEPTTEHTWFDGYAWRVQLCTTCGTHLGWRFSSGGDSFFGLILSRVASR